MKTGKLLLEARTAALKHAIEHLTGAPVRKVEICSSPRCDMLVIRATFCDGLEGSSLRNLPLTKIWTLSASSIANSGISSISGAPPEQLSVLLEEAEDGPPRHSGGLIFNVSIPSGAECERVMAKYTIFP